MGNHELYMRRRKPDTIEVQQMKQQAQDDKHAKQMERQDHVIRQKQLEEEKRAKEELQTRLARLEKEALHAQEGRHRVEYVLLLYPLTHSLIALAQKESESRQLEDKMKGAEDKAREMESQREKAETERMRAEHDLSSERNKSEQSAQEAKEAAQMATQKALEAEAAAKEAQNLKNEVPSLLSIGWEELCPCVSSSNGMLT